MPDVVDNVSKAIALFSKEQCQFSIKGGGHSTIPGAANINDGVMMAMERINNIEVNTKGMYVIAGAGLRLGNVYLATDKYNVVPIIGRYATIGFGLAVGAGLSYLGNREGLAVDNVLGYEIVLYNGTVINANATSHVDLFWALKGGNNNFGVVTHYKLRTFKSDGEIYGGQIFYPQSSLDQMTDVVYDYHVRQAVEDVYTHAMPLYGYNGTTNETIGMTPVMYNKAVDKLPPILRGWTDVPYTLSTLQRRTYGNLSAHLNEGAGDGLV